MRFSKKITLAAEAIAFIAGAAIFWHLLRVAGFEALQKAWFTAGPRLAFVFALYPLMALWDTAAWHNFFRGVRVPSFLSLFWIRLAGEAVNSVTPGADIGGEPLKVKWLHERQGVSVADGASSAILAKTATLLSEGLFVWIGVWAGWSLVTWPVGVREGVAAAAALVGVVVVLIFLFQRTTLFGGWSPSTQDFYGRFMPRFYGSILLSLAGWLSGCVELWIFSHLLGDGLDWRQALVIEALVQLVRVVSFFIPGNVGTQEAGYVFLVQLMSFDPALGMALSLLKRVRQLGWTAVGFGIWVIFDRPKGVKIKP